MLLATQRSMGLITYPFFWSSSVYRLYHCSADSIQTYTDLNTCIYRTLWHYTRGLHHTLYIKNPCDFNKIFFPSGISACKYAPGTLNVATYLSGYQYIINVVNSSLSDTVGDAILYPFFKYCLCLLLFELVIPFMDTYRFFFIRFTASRAFYLSEPKSTSRLISAMTFFWHGDFAYFFTLSPLPLLIFHQTDLNKYKPVFV